MPVFTFKVNTDNYKYWYKNSKFHRDCDLPAIDNCISIHESNYRTWYKSWYKNGIQSLPTFDCIKIFTIKIQIMKMGNKWWYIAL